MGIRAWDRYLDHGTCLRTDRLRVYQVILLCSSNSVTPEFSRRKDGWAADYSREPRAASARFWRAAERRFQNGSFHTRVRDECSFGCQG